MELLISLDERPHVVAVDTRVVGKERQGVHAFAREIVQRADERLAFAVLPGGIICLPILEVRLVAVQRLLRFRLARTLHVGATRQRAVKIFIREQRLRHVGAGLEEELFRASELKMMPADMFSY
ncbi:MAG: hypothetical protein ABI651_01930 [Verrucomicrobiota bacterium]